MSNDSSGRLRSRAIAPPCVRTRRSSRLEHDEVLADRDRRHVELLGKVRDPSAAVLLDDPGDVLLPFTCEDVLRGGAGTVGHGLSFPRVRQRSGGAKGGFVWMARAQ